MLIQNLALFLVLAKQIAVIVTWVEPTKKLHVDFICNCVCIFVSACAFVHVSLVSPEDTFKFLELELESGMSYWKWVYGRKFGSFGEHHMLLITEPPLQPQIMLLFIALVIPLLTQQTQRNVLKDKVQMAHLSLLSPTSQ